MSEYAELLKRLKDIKKREEFCNTLNTIAFLMAEEAGKVETSATYDRKFKHGRLSISVTYNR